MEPEGLLLCSQEPTAAPYPEIWYHFVRSC